jgi:uncharacterized membrane protein YdjX (TVP38/TMEM64 family)
MKNINRISFVSNKNILWTISFILLMIAIVVLYYYLDKQNLISTLIQGWGFGGVLLAIFLIALIFMTPVPSEGLLIIYFKIFGPFFGVFYAWIGTLISSLFMFLLARKQAKWALQKLITPQYFNMVNAWIKERGSIGLFFARLLPIPAFAVNYIAGAMPSVKLWPYFWTAALSIIPYYTGALLIYYGASQKTLYYLIIGLIGVALLWGLSYCLSKK